jgi:vacuolar protein sorting-associated protein 16
MSVSPNGRLLALFTGEGVLQVVSADFTKNFSVFPTKTRSGLKQLVWCGVDSVVLHWDKLLLMVGPNGDYIEYVTDPPWRLCAHAHALTTRGCGSYTYETALHLVPEVDGVRIVTNTKCEFLQRVPSKRHSTFGPRRSRRHRRA